jgi:hypothetical protein
METLNTLLSKSAQEWTDNDILQLIEAFTRTASTVESGTISRD